MRTIIILSGIVIITSLAGCMNQKELTINQNLNTNWQFRQVGAEQWLPATVPGCNHTDLLANGKIEDPFWRMNEANLQWIDKLDWEYKTIFQVKPQLLIKDRVMLDFQGLDTYAEVSLNGNPLLTADNMFRQWQVDVKDILLPGDNELRILFRSPITEGIKKYDALDYVIPVSDNDMAKHGQVEGDKKVSVFTRKAPYHFGWDWGPRLVSSGVWRPIVLKAWDQARILDLHLIQKSVSEQSATLTAVFEVEAEQSTNATLEIVTDGQILHADEVALKPGAHTYNVDFTITNPKLWWTNGLGEPHLYTLTGKLITQTGAHSRTERIGIRTVELVRANDEYGTSFTFKLNGIPVFMKGANYIPNDIYPTRVSDDKYRRVIETARTSNFNMLRVWGGGIYENDLFYDLCDEAGILVWQDFMFACAMYPSDKQFLDNVRLEAIDNVKRLRNHPCIALWCGNNENLAAWLQWGWKKQAEAKGQAVADIIWQGYTDLFHHILPEVVAEYDSGRFYWSSSPSTGEGKPSDLAHGDEHYWRVWHGRDPYETYADNIGRFMSEYGFQSFPALPTVQEYALPEDYGLLTDVMKAHQRSYIGNEAIKQYMLRDYQEPKDFESFLYVGQVLQAEIIRFAVEAHRRAMGQCMGSLYWQINDCWPVASWSSMDSSLRWKAEQYFVKKAFEPILISPFMIDDNLKIYLVNDHLCTLKGNLSLRLLDFNGKQLWQKTIPTEVPANAARVCFETQRPALLNGLDDTSIMLIAEWVENDQVLADCVYYFRKVKDLNLPNPEIEYDFKKGTDGFEITLKSQQLAKNVYLMIGKEEGFFEDNYFDLLPGKAVTIDLKTTMNKDQLEQAFSLRCLPSAF